MIKITLSNLRNNTDFFKMNNIATIINGRKKEELGYFIPSKYKNEFEKFLKSIEEKRQRDLLKRVLKASREDSIGDGTIDDGIK